MVTKQYHVVLKGWFWDICAKGGCTCVQTAPKGSQPFTCCSLPQHSKTDQGLPVTASNFALNKIRLLFKIAQMLFFWVWRGGLEKIGKQYKKCCCATSGPATSSGSLSHRNAPLPWSQSCLKWALASHAAVCCLLSPLPVHLPQLGSWWALSWLLLSIINLLQIWEDPLIVPRNYAAVLVSWMCLKKQVLFSPVWSFALSVSVLMHCLPRWVLVLPEGMQQLGVKWISADRLTGLKTTWKCTLNSEQRTKLCLCCCTHAYLLKGHLYTKIATCMCVIYVVEDYSGVYVSIGLRHNHFCPNKMNFTTYVPPRHHYNFILTKSSRI